MKGSRCRPSTKCGTPICYVEVGPEARARRCCWSLYPFNLTRMPDEPPASSPSRATALP
jgi:hypothetical protein